VTARPKSEALLYALANAVDGRGTGAGHRAHAPFLAVNPKNPPA
jgi:hypothetical protein